MNETVAGFLRYVVAKDENVFHHPSRAGTHLARAPGAHRQTGSIRDRGPFATVCDHLRPGAVGALAGFAVSGQPTRGRERLQ